MQGVEHNAHRILCEHHSRARLHRHIALATVMHHRFAPEPTDWSCTETSFGGTHSDAIRVGDLSKESDTSGA